MIRFIERIPPNGNASTSSLEEQSRKKCDRLRQKDFLETGKAIINSCWVTSKFEEWETKEEKEFFSYTGIEKSEESKKEYDRRNKEEINKLDK